eukprot:c18302_g2_i1.p1 GENE.c18302_g2_i1~~c18302_g2_i1.p1  ORF type:complete len:329 (+),score=151.86 c18302_g2_i1:3-989(+)
MGEVMSTQKVPIRNLGSQGLKVSAQGLGCMGMTVFYGNDPIANEEKSIETFGKALEMGINFLDTAWIYKDSTTGAINEELVGRALKKYGRDNFIIATKFGFVPNFGRDSKPETIRKQCQESLERLGINCIDLYYQHRPDPNTPIEEVIKVLKELINEGKIKYIGLSECTADELRRAHAVHPITAIQMEYSLQCREIEKEIIPVARELNVGIVAYSPLGKGLLSQTFEKYEDIPPNHWRKRNPKSTKEIFEKNLKATAKVAEIANRKGCTPAQIALAWVHSRGEDIFPIPGTSKPENLVSNASYVFVNLSAEDCAELEAAVPEATDERY